MRLIKGYVLGLFIICSCILMYILSPEGTTSQTKHGLISVKHTQYILEVDTAPFIPAPPSQEWIKEQFDRVYTLLDSQYKPPTNWASVKFHTLRHCTYYFPNLSAVYTAIPNVGPKTWLEAMAFAEAGHLIKLPTVKSIVAENITLHGPRQKLKSAKAPGSAMEYLLFGDIAQKPFLFDISTLHHWGVGLYNYTHNDTIIITPAMSFIILRNPWVRAVSGYIQNLSDLRELHRKEESLNENLTVIKPESEPEPTFEEFILDLDGQINTVKYLVPQWNYLFSDHVRYDHVMSLEHAALMSEGLFNRLGTRLSVWRSIDEYDKAGSFLLMAKELLEQLQPRAVEEFYKVYELDFLLLNYSNFTHPNFPYPLHM